MHMKRDHPGVRTSNCDIARVLPPCRIANRAAPEFRRFELNIRRGDDAIYGSRRRPRHATARKLQESDEGPRPSRVSDAVDRKAKERGAPLALRAARYNQIVARTTALRQEAPRRGPSLRQTRGWLCIARRRDRAKFPRARQLREQAANADRAISREW